ncbi:1-deoxy-D-xylulose-5-phosphate synthase [Clostridia bacterium]|nr:1-deoxy-D-xylulose-5-phosphate synthase [Clostridia bacterium]
MILENIHNPRELRTLSMDERRRLADEIRSVIINTVERQGGHLSSNLGAVELTIALHTALNLPADKLVFDVGHQCYTHKLLTGRRQGFELLRAGGGVSGFPKRDESAYDCFGTGHASTAVSAALGFARARDLRGEGYKVAALVGDGALTGGLAYEALNDAGKFRGQLLVVLNDNEMSIVRNVGALNEHLTRLRTSARWIGAKRAVKIGLDRIPLVGPSISTAVEWLKTFVRRMLVRGEFFESLGFRYLGPVDGHDLGLLSDIVADALRAREPTVLHVVTRKGKGSPEAEAAPERYHGVTKKWFSPDVRPLAPGMAVPEEGSCAAVVGETLSELADSDARIVAITAAMSSGTGLDRFEARHPSRFFDTAIAEAHAVTLAAGMAAGGLRPMVAVYSTFIQRAMDSIIHDVCLQNLPVTLLLDHTGFVAGDGPTHQGIFDLNLLRPIPNLTIWTPSDLDELRGMLRAATGFNGPLVIRYPKSLVICADNVECADARVALLAFGASYCPAMEAAAILCGEGLPAKAVRISSVKPLEEDILTQLTSMNMRLIAIEEGQRAGGLGGALAEWCQDNSKPAPLLRLGIDDSFPMGYALETLRHGLTGLDIAKAVRIAVSAANNKANER